MAFIEKNNKNPTDVSGIVSAIFCLPSDSALQTTPKCIYSNDYICCDEYGGFIDTKRQHFQRVCVAGSFCRCRSRVEKQALSDMFTITDKPAEQHSR